MIHEVFLNDLGIKNHLVLLRTFDCEKCKRHIRRLERYWEINHYGTPSGFDDGHMHIACTTCAPTIQQAEAYFLSNWRAYVSCDYHEYHVSKMREMLAPQGRNMTGVPTAPKIEVTDDDLRFALEDICDSPEEAKFRFEKKFFGGLVMHVAEAHARDRCVG
jgi:hypothetical protein